MRTSSFKQFDVIREEDPEVFTAKLNTRLRELRHNWPEVKISEGDRYILAQISYTEHDRVPEDLGDVYEMQNVKFTCQDCPIFEPIQNRDGSLNLRVKYGKCPYAEFGRTYKEARCCDMMYTLLRNGKIQLTMVELED